MQLFKKKKIGKYFDDICATYTHCIHMTLGKSFTDVSKEYYYSLFWVLPAPSLSSKLECRMQIPLKDLD